MFDVILVESIKDSSGAIKIFSLDNKDKNIQMISTEQLFSSKYIYSENTIILHNVDFKEIDIGGIEKILDNSDYIYNQSYKKSIFIPTYNLFGGLTASELLLITEKFIDNEDSYLDLLNMLKDIFNNMDEDLLKYVIRNKKFLYYEKITPNKNIKDLEKELNFQIKQNSFFKKQNTNTDLTSIVDFELFNKFVKNEPFLEYNNIVQSKKIINLNFDTESKKNLDFKKIVNLTNIYEGFILSDNIEINNQSMQYLNYPNIRKINEDILLFPFSLLRYSFLDFEKIDIKEFYITDRKQMFKEPIKFTNKNKLSRLLISILNFKYNFDNFDTFNQNQLIGYLNLFIFESLTSEKNKENVRISLLWQKYGKFSLSLSNKNLLEDYDKYLKEINFIPIN